MCIKNNNFPSIEHCEIPALTLVNTKICLFKPTPRFLFLTKRHTINSKSCQAILF